MNKVAAGLGVLYVLWGSTYLAIRYAIESMPPLGMSGLRFLLAGLLLYGFRARGRSQPTLRHWASATLVGFLLIGTGTGLIAWSEQFLSSGQAALIVAAVPLWMALWAWLKPGGAFPGGRVLIGLLVSTLGLGLLVASATHFSWASLLVLLSSLSWAAGSLLSPAVSQPQDSIQFSAMTMVAGGSCLCLTSLLLNEPWHAGVSWTSGFAWVYLVVFGSMLGLSLYTWLLRNASPVAISTYTYVNPLVAVVLARLSGEELPAQLPAATLLILLGLLLIQCKSLGLWPRAFQWSLPMVGRPLPAYRTAGRPSRAA